MIDDMNPEHNCIPDISVLADSGNPSGMAFRALSIAPSAEAWGVREKDNPLRNLNPATTYDFEARGQNMPSYSFQFLPLLPATHEYTAFLEAFERAFYLL